MLAKQGVELVALHASFEPLTGPESVEKAKELAELLGLKQIYVARIGEELAKIPQDRAAHKYYFVLQKRLLYRLADRLADDVDADTIATGENLGQVSSQTLRNLATLDEAARRPVLRPLLGLDKQDIVDYARRTGTYETSIGPELCDLLGPTKPATVSDVANVTEHEQRVGMDAGGLAIELVTI